LATTNHTSVSPASAVSTSTVAASNTISPTSSTLTNMPYWQSANSTSPTALPSNILNTNTVNSTSIASVSPA